MMSTKDMLTSYDRLRLAKSSTRFALLFTRSRASDGQVVRLSAAGHYFVGKVVGGQEGRRNPARLHEAVHHELNVVG